MVRDNNSTGDQRQKLYRWSETITLQDLDFAEEIASLCHSSDNQQKLPAVLARAAGTVRLLICTSRTNIINVNGGEGTVRLVGEDFENAEILYLGRKVSDDGIKIRAIRTRMGKAAVAS